MPKNKNKAKDSRRKRSNPDAPSFNRSSRMNEASPITNTPTSVIFRSPRGQGFPDRYRCTLRCSNFFVLSGGTAGAVRTVCWLGNALYGVGPNVDAGGYNANYPTDLAQFFSSSAIAGSNVYAPPYSAYRVFGSKIELQITGSGAAGTNTHCALWPSSDSLAALYSTIKPGFSQAREFPYSKSMIIPGYSTSSKVATLSNGATTDRMFGVPPVLVNAQEYASTGTSGPTYTWFHNLVLVPENANAVTASVTWQIDYDVELFNRTMPYTGAP